MNFVKWKFLFVVLLGLLMVGIVMVEISCLMIKFIEFNNMLDIKFFLVLLGKMMYFYGGDVVKVLIEFEYNNMILRIVFNYELF